MFLQEFPRCIDAPPSTRMSAKIAYIISRTGAGGHFIKCGDNGTISCPKLSGPHGNLSGVKDPHRFAARGSSKLRPKTSSRDRVLGLSSTRP